MINVRDCLVNEIIQDKNARILEIGPLNYPVIKKEVFPNCFYCDIRDTEEVRKLYSGNEYLETTGIQIDVAGIVDIDFVLKGSYAETFEGTPKFDYVVASHVLEHVVDIIGFFQDVGSVLQPEGKLCVFYPDKRYCFDHFRESASFRDAYDVYRRGSRETARMVLDFINTSIDENDPRRFWNAEDLASLVPQNDSANAIRDYERVLNGETMDDVHYWPFTDHAFLQFLYDCVKADLLPFSCVEFYPTQRDTQQFFALLEYHPELFKNKQLELRNLVGQMKKVPLDFYNAKYLEWKKRSAEYDFLEQENSVLNFHVAELQRQNSVMAQTNAEVIDNNKLLANTIEQLTQERQALESALRIIENSTAWRMTKPIRRLLDILKKPFKK